MQANYPNPLILSFGLIYNNQGCNDYIAGQLASGNTFNVSFDMSDAPKKPGDNGLVYLNTNLENNFQAFQRVQLSNEGISGQLAFYSISSTEAKIFDQLVTISKLFLVGTPTMDGYSWYSGVILEGGCIIINKNLTEALRNKDLREFFNKNLKVVGKLNYQIILTDLPAGWTLQVTSIQNKNDSGDWYIYSWLGDNYPVVQGGSIAYFMISSTSFWDSGTGPSATVYFTVTDNDGNSRQGYVIASTTDWGHVERPDYELCTFGFLSEAATAPIYMEVPDLTDPGTFDMGFGKDNDGNIIIVGSSDQNVTDELISDIVMGLIKVQTKLLSWVL